jgi:hypothetical protein
MNPEHKPFGEVTRMNLRAALRGKAPLHVEGNTTRAIVLVGVLVADALVEAAREVAAAIRERS